MSTVEREDTLFNQTFRDSEGNIAIAQMPNLPILVYSDFAQTLDPKWQPSQGSRCTGIWLLVCLGVARVISGR